MHRLEFAAIQKMNTAEFKDYIFTKNMYNQGLYKETTFPG